MRWLIAVLLCAALLEPSGACAQTSGRLEPTLPIRTWIDGRLMSQTDPASQIASDFASEADAQGWSLNEQEAGLEYLLAQIAAMQGDDNRHHAQRLRDGLEAIERQRAALREQIAIQESEIGGEEFSSSTGRSADGDPNRAERPPRVP
jgi:hypothetical protein